MVIVTDSLRKFLLSEDKRGYDKDTQRQYYNRLAERSETAIKDLVLLAEKMPSRYTEKIFETSNLMPLFRAIFQAPKDMTEESRTRLLELAQLLTNLINYDLAPYLAPELYTLLKDARIETDMIGIKSIWLTRRGYHVEKKSKPKKITISQHSR